MKVLHVASALVLAVYLPLCLVPGEWFWFDPGVPVFEDTVQGTSPALTYWRDIKIEGLQTYAALVREKAAQAPVCDGGLPGVFPYHKDAGPVVGKDLDWWMGKKCNLKPGYYWIETTWTIPAPLASLLPYPLSDLFGWILPPKYITRISPVFQILKVTE